MKILPHFLICVKGTFAVFLITVFSLDVGRISAEVTAAEGNSGQAALREPVLLEGAQMQEEIIVQAESEYDARVQDRFLPPVQGTKIYSGKKASVLDLDALPQVVANDYRQALSSTPGLLYSEESTPLVSIGYRGIGDPHRTQFMQVLKDGVPIHADPYGYPEAYYTPPLDVVDRLEFVRGGGGLMYGPQPGGALNYVTAMPRTDRPFSARSSQIFGSDGLYSTYNSVDGTVGRVGYLAYYNHRESEGFRSANSDYVLDGAAVKFVIDGQTDTRWIFNMDAYEEAHGEPGGLTLATGPGTVNYNADRNQASREFDRFHLRRYVPSLAFEKDFSEETRLEVRTWGGYYERGSRRQRGGGFGTVPTGAAALTNDIELQEFFTWGLDGRVAHDWQAWGGNHTFSGGFTTYFSHSPRTDRRGGSPDATEGFLRRDAHRGTASGAVFVENRFVFGSLSLTPGIRVEQLHQRVLSRQVVAPVSSREEHQDETVPLLALGLAYDTGRDTEVYANVSQSYRPVIFTEALSPDPTTVVAGDIESGNSWTYEVGWRGTPVSWAQWDTSLFLIDLDNKYGTVTVGGVNTITSVGRAINYGWDAAVEIDLIGLYDQWQQDDLGARAGKISLYANSTLMSSEIHGGVSDGKDPQYAPDASLRGGVIYRWQDRAKVAFLGTWVGEHFANDSETANRHIPAYMVWDLTAEVNVYRDHVSLLGGVKNLLDEDYYARIRGDGIDPAYGRNFYVGLKLQY
ncbi:MAG: TonB-dependent receptor [Candidatus Methylacidiphilales bacterium]|nr:TonB-dependent receptor [Candidatus Methylacidiphilales bacterium]